MSDIRKVIHKYMDIFIGILDVPHFYIQTRGLVLIAINTKWDTEKKLNAVM